MQGTIRRARLEDAEALHRHCYGETALEDVRDYLAWCLRQGEKGRIVRLVAEVGDQAVANAQLTVWGDRGEIGSLVVGRAFRRQGLARQLVTALITQGQERGLAGLEISVRQSQPHVLAFYRQLGFEIVEAQKNGLSHPACSEPVVHLWMRLPGR
ncbi:MAG: GNAT family N-acetyltransferase [Anaerolineae bacterium]|jgi:ribosomal protein S18 acetylase RimI-like enzyme